MSHILPDLQRRQSEDSVIFVLEAGLKSLRKEYDEYKSQSHEIEEELEHQVKSKEIEIENLTNLLANLKRNAEKHKSRIIDLEKEVEKYSQKSKNFEEELKTAKAKTVRLEQETEELENRLRICEAERYQLNDKATHFEEELLIIRIENEEQALSREDYIKSLLQELAVLKEESENYKILNDVKRTYSLNDADLPGNIHPNQQDSNLIKQINELEKCLENSDKLLEDSQKEFALYKKYSETAMTELEAKQEKIKEDFNKKTEVFLSEINRLKDLIISHGDRAEAFLPERRVISLPDERNEKESPKGINKVVYRNLDDRKIQLSSILTPVKKASSIGDVIVTSNDKTAKKKLFILSPKNSASPLENRENEERLFYKKYLINSWGSAKSSDKFEMAGRYSVKVKKNPPPLEENNFLNDTLLKAANFDKIFDQMTDFEKFVKLGTNPSCFESNHSNSERSNLHIILGEKKSRKKLILLAVLENSFDRIRRKVKSNPEGSFKFEVKFDSRCSKANSSLLVPFEISLEISKDSTPRRIEELNLAFRKIKNLFLANRSNKDTKAKFRVKRFDLKLFQSTHGVTDSRIIFEETIVSSNVSRIPDELLISKEKMLEFILNIKSKEDSGEERELFDSANLEKMNKTLYFCLKLSSKLQALHSLIPLLSEPKRTPSKNSTPSMLRSSLELSALTRASSPSVTEKELRMRNPSREKSEGEIFLKEIIGKLRGELEVLRRKYLDASRENNNLEKKMVLMEEKLEKSKKFLIHILRMLTKTNNDSRCMIPIRGKHIRANGGTLKKIEKQIKSLHRIMKILNSEKTPETCEGVN